MVTLKATFLLEKETKGAIRYVEVDAAGHEEANPIIRTIYLRKSAYAGGLWPQSITVAVIPIEG